MENSSLSQANRFIFRTQFGSQVYGTSTPQSDTDYKGIYVPPAKDLVLQRGKKTINTSTGSNNSKNGPDDVDFEAFTVQRYLEHLLSGQLVALDMLFTPEKFHEETSVYWHQIQSYRNKFLHQNILPYLGYCQKQAAKYGIKGSRIATVRAAKALIELNVVEDRKKLTLNDIWEDVEWFTNRYEHTDVILDEKSSRNSDKDLYLWQVCGKSVQQHCTLDTAYQMFQRQLKEYGERALQAEKNEGVDWKAMMHAVRICFQAEELLLDHHITFPRPEAELLLRIRSGEMDFNAVAQILEEKISDVHAAKERSSLPEEPDHQFAEDFLIGIYVDRILNEEL